MKIDSFFTTLFLFIIASSHSQTPDIEWPKAEVLFKEGIYAEAITYYESAIDQNKANGHVYYKAGVCYLHSRSLKHLAIPCFEKAIELNTSFYTHGQAKLSDAPMDVYLLLAEACRQHFLPEKALKALQDYKEKLNTNTPEETVSIQKVEDLILRTKYELSLKNLYALPVNFRFPEFLVNDKNECGDFSSLVAPDKKSIIYTIKVALHSIRRGVNPYFEDIQINLQKQEKNPDVVAKKKHLDYLPDTVVNIATIGLSANGHAMLTYKNHQGSCHLLLQQLLANEWSRSKTVHRSSNPEGWEKGEYQTADGQRLYFISNRPGGYGGYDLYYCQRLPSGNWSKAFNLGPEINTEFDEVAPFPMPNGKALYFSSNRLQPKKSYDVYLASITENGFRPPALTGYPINSAESNLYYQVATTKKITVAESETQKNNKRTLIKKQIHSSGPNSLQSETAEWQTNYVLTFENKEAGSITLLRAAIIGNSPTTDSSGQSFILTDLSSGKIFQTYKSINPGSIEVILPTEKKYGLNCHSKNYFSDSYLLETSQTEKAEKFGPIPMHPIQSGSTWEIQTVTFNEDTDQLKNFSIIELKRWCDFMKQHADSKIQITYTLQTSDKKLMTLAKQRVKKIKNYLTETGIEDTRVRTKSNLIKPDVRKNVDKKDSRQKDQLLIELVKLN